MVVMIAAITEYCSYAFVLLMFAGKFGTIKAIAFYLPAGLWALRLLFKKEMGFNWKDPLFLLIMLFFVSALVSALMGEQYLHSLKVLKKEHLKLLLLYCTICSVFYEPGRLKRFAYIMAVVGVVYLAYAYFDVGRYLIKHGFSDYLEVRYFATILLFFFPFILMRYMDSKWMAKILFFFPLFATIAGLFILGVRASWIGLVVILVLWGTLSGEYFFNRLKPLVLIIVATLMVLSTFLIFPSQYKIIKKHTMETIQMQQRLTLWDTFSKISLEKPLYGHGLDDNDMAGNYLKSYTPLTGHVHGKEEPSSPHDQFLKIFYQQGLIGLIIYSLIILITIGRLIYAIIKHQEASVKFLGLAILSSLVGEYLIRTIFEDRSLIPLGVILGMAGAYFSKTKE
ncbi:MAG: O-antigen ligase family protein [Nitrospirae bacterium]|nr:O-antigen ligase family protein [Nitrospirota bacterium]